MPRQQGRMTGNVHRDEEAKVQIKGSPRAKTKKDTVQHFAFYNLVANHISPSPKSSLFLGVLKLHTCNLSNSSPPHLLDSLRSRLPHISIALSHPRSHFQGSLSQATYSVIDRGTLPPKAPTQHARKRGTILSNIRQPREQPRILPGCSCLRRRPGGGGKRQKQGKQ